MRVLFVSTEGFFYNNSSAIQNIGIVCGLKELGAEVDLLTLQPQKDTVGFDRTIEQAAQQYISKTYFIPLNGLYEKLNKKKKLVVENTGKEKKWLTSLKGKIRRAIKKFLIFDVRVLNIKNINKVSINTDQYDIIISASDPKSTHCFANALIKKNHFKGKYIQYWGDPLYMDITRDKSIIDGLYRIAEKRTLQYADKIVYATPFTLQEQQKLYPEYANRMSYAHQAAIQLGKYEESNCKRNNDECIGIVYCGDYRKETRNIMPLYSAVKNMDASVKLDIYGTSNLNLANEDNITVHGQVSRKIADSAENNADVLFCICNLKGSQIPGKIYYLTALQKPIIVAVDGDYKTELCTYFETMNRFIVCHNNEDSIMRAIKKVFELRKIVSYVYNKEEFSSLKMVERIINKS